MAESKEASLKPRIFKGLCIIFSTMMFCTIPNSSRAYIPYVQPLATKRPLPRVKVTKFVPKKIVKGYGTGYFGPKRKDYKTEEAYQEAVRMNGEGVETNSGTKPRIGTIAADISEYPFGTIIYIPERDFWTVVEDVGPAVRGKRHIDIFCGHGKKARRIAKTWGAGTPITLVVMEKTEVWESSES